MRVIDRIRKHLLCSCGIVEPLPRIPHLEELKRTEWSSEFERYMRNRHIMGAIRYGRLGASDKPQYDRCDYIKRKIEEYQTTGNLECLVDVAVLAACEFVEGNHPKRHFESKGDHNERAKEIK